MKNTLHNLFVALTILSSGSMILAGTEYNEALSKSKEGITDWKDITDELEKTGFNREHPGAAMRTHRALRRAETVVAHLEEMGPRKFEAMRRKEKAIEHRETPKYTRHEEKAKATHKEPKKAAHESKKITQKTGLSAPSSRHAKMVKQFEDRQKAREEAKRRKAKN